MAEERIPLIETVDLKSILRWATSLIFMQSMVST